MQDYYIIVLQLREPEGHTLFYWCTWDSIIHLIGRHSEDNMPHPLIGACGMLLHIICFKNLCPQTNIPSLAIIICSYVCHPTKTLCLNWPQREDLPKGSLPYNYICQIHDIISVLYNNAVMYNHYFVDNTHLAMV